MDAYLDCLYQYISDNLLLDARLDLIDYSRWTRRKDAAWNALQEALAPGQIQLVEAYLHAADGRRFLEDELLFQRAVDLGKWMAR